MRRLLALGLAVATTALFVGTVSAASGGPAAPPSAFTGERFLTHWWVFPASILFSMVALAAGVSGALFFSPFFMLVVGLTPSQATGAGLVTEVSGMSNGLRSYVQQGVVDYRTAKWLLVGAVPAVVGGALAANVLEPTVLKLAFGAGLVVLGGFLIYYDTPEAYEPGEYETAFLAEKNTSGDRTTVEAADGETYVYDTCWRPPGVALSTVGGFITGLISAGLPEIVTTQLIVRCRIPPGVIVGGTVGTHVSKHVPGDLMEVGLGSSSRSWGFSCSVSN